jgi:hypothetical protein
MSTGTAEYELLDVDTDKAPPCEVGLSVIAGVTRTCGQPAAARLRVTCECGNNGHMFICRRHLEDQKMTGLECGQCDSDKFSWCES